MEKCCQDLLKNHVVLHRRKSFRFGMTRESKPFESFVADEIFLVFMKEVSHQGCIYLI